MNKKTFASIVIAVTLVFGAYIAGQKLEAQTQLQKIDVTTAQVNAFGVCRNVINSGTLPLLAPLKTKDEWCTLIKADPNLANVSFTTCQTCSWVSRCGCGNCVKDWVCTPFNIGTCT